MPMRGEDIQFRNCKKECRNAIFWLAQLRSVVNSQADLARLFQDNGQITLGGFGPISRAPDFSSYTWGYLSGLKCELKWDHPRARLANFKFSCNICSLG